MTEQQDWLKSLVEKRGYCTVAEILLDIVQKLLSLFLLFKCLLEGIETPIPKLSESLN